MENQKFKRGNKCRIISEYVPYSGYFDGVERGRIKNEHYNDEVIILYSYAEKYGGNDTYNYSVIKSDGSCEWSWVNKDELELIEIGGEYLIDEAKEMQNKIHLQHSNIVWIKNNFGFNLPSDSILHLFKLIDYDSAFNHNGEFISLYSDWCSLYYIFESLFKNDKDKMIEYINKCFKSEYVTKYLNSFLKLFENVNN